MFEFDWIIIGVYGIVAAFTLWAIFRVWKTYGIFSVIAPSLSALGYGIASMCDHFEWSFNWVFWSATIVWTILWIFAFIGALTNGEIASEEMKKQWKESSERARKQQEYNATHWYFHNSNSTYNRYVNPHSPTYHKK